MSLKNKILIFNTLSILTITFSLFQATGISFYILLIMLIILSVSTYQMYIFLNENYKTVLHKLELLKSSDYSEVQEKVSKGGDEFNQINYSLTQLTHTLREVTLVAKNVASGDFSVKISAQEENNVLASSMNSMVDILAENLKTENEQTWLDNAILGLNRLLSNDISLEDTTDACIHYLCKQVNAFTGMLYLYAHKEQSLTLSAAYAFFPTANPTTYKLGEGTIGEVAKSSNFIEHNNITNNYENNLDNLTSQAKIHTFTFSLSYQEKIHGAIELATYTELTDLEREFLLQTENIIATALASAKGKKDVETLLGQVQIKNNEMLQREKAQDAHSIVGITDVKGTITYVNEKFSQISGYSHDELIGANHRIVNSGEYDSNFWKNMYKTVSSGEVWHHPAIKNQAKDGSFYWVATTISALLNEKGKPEAYIAIRTDVTEGIKTNLELEVAKHDAESAVQAKADFLASMSHEIRTPMNGVIGMLGLLLNSKLSEKQLEHAQLAESSATSLLSVINDILDFSKLEAGKVELENINYDLNQELGNFAKSIAINIKDKDVELLVDCSEVKHSQIVGDIGRLKQVLNNLVGNAIKFTHQGNVIIRAKLVEYTSSEAQICIDVIDSGIGIAEEYLETLFDAFTQADNSTTRKYGGTGLGLSIAKNLTEVMGGELKVTSELGVGTTFSFCVDAKLSHNSPLVLPNIDVTNKKILIVDDNTVNIEILATQLKTWQLNVTSAFSAKQALDICKELTKKDPHPPFDILITDMEMPEMNGESLAVEIQKIEHCKDIKIVLMTSFGRHNDMQKLETIGFDAFFTKPVATSDLFKALNVLVSDDKKIKEEAPVLTSNKLNTFIPDASNWKNNAKILLVEDNLTNQLVAQGILEGLGLEADVASNGQVAVDMLHDSQNNYDLVLMDCQMPVLDGFEATQAIREGDAGQSNKTITIVAMTANAMEGDKEKCIVAGMDDYLAKPIIPEKFKNLLLKYLRES